ncbi:MAG: aminoglycoside phosphotransferase family protein [Alphaproteobacteria bacterium]|nr:aminoglycoside phosphotransferase family protein [Alphaproteobacteria bacterium]
MSTVKTKIGSGHESDAFLVEDAKLGKSVELASNAKTGARRVMWKQKRQLAQGLVLEISNLNNPTYRIPKTLAVENNKFSLEFADAEQVTSELFSSLPQQDKNAVINGLANFMRDMHHLRPIREVGFRGDIFAASIADIAQGHVSPKDLKILKKAEKDLSGLPEGSEVFSHYDFESDNVLYDKKSKILWILDLAESNYRPAYYDFYSQYFRALGISDELLNVYKNLPGADKVNLDFNAEKLMLGDDLQDYLEDADITNPTDLIKGIVSKIKAAKWHGGKTATLSNIVEGGGIMNMNDRRIDRDDY